MKASFNFFTADLSLFDGSVVREDVRRDCRPRVCVFVEISMFPELRSISLMLLLFEFAFVLDGDDLIGER